MNHRLLVALLLSVSLLSLGGFAVSGQDSPGNVPMFRGNPARTGEMPGLGPDPSRDIVELWAFSTGGGIYSSPGIVDGVVYVGSRDHNVYAIDATSGQQIWSFATEDEVLSSPAVVDGVVYAGSQDGSLYAVDAVSGAQRWAFKIGDGVWSSPVVVDGVVYVGSTDGNLYAVGAATGQKLWVFATGDAIWSSSPAVVDGVVYFGSVDRKLYAVDADSGQQRWAFTTGDTVASSPAVVDGVVYVGSWDQHLYAIDASAGQQRWTFAIDAEGLVGYMSDPTVVDGVAYVYGSGDLYAINASTGQQIWAWTPGSEVTSPAAADGLVYVRTLDNRIHAIDVTSGQQIWELKPGGESSSSPAIMGGGGSSPAVAEGVVYVGSEDGNLYAIGNPPTEMQTAIAESQANATAQADLDSTATAAAQATGTSEAQATANAMATAEAIEQARDAYFQTIGNTVSESANGLPGVAIDAAPQFCPEEQIPSSFEYCRSYEASIAGGNGETWAALAIYASNDEATAAFEQMKGGLPRSGWMVEDVDGLDHNHVCLTLVQDETSQGICYMTRDDALIVSYSYLDVDAPAAALQNAVDLAKLMNDAYDQVDRPE